MSKELKRAIKELIKLWIEDFKKRKDIDVKEFLNAFYFNFPYDLQRCLYTRPILWMEFKDIYFGNNKYIIDDLIKKEFKKGGII